MISIEIRAKECVTDQIRKYAGRRVRLALDRFRDVRRVVVFLDDLNGPKGGMDKFCRIVAECGFASVVVEESQTDWHTAIASATHRLAHNIAQELKRSDPAIYRTMKGSREATSENHDLREAR